MAEQKWTSSAGPIQTKKVNQAMKDLGWHAKTITRLTDHGEFSSIPLFSPVNNAAYTKVYAELGERFAWTVTRENYQDVIKAFQEAKSKVPVTVVDERTTPEQRAERERLGRIAEEERAVKDAAFKVEYDKLVAELRAKYPNAKSVESGLSSHARAAANVRMELAAAFPGISFSVKSKTFSGGDSINVRWELGPTAKEVKEITDKYQEGNFNGMIDLYEYDRSAYRKAADTVLGNIKYMDEDREIPVRCMVQVRDWIIADMQLPVEEFTGTDWVNKYLSPDRGAYMSQVIYAAFRDVSLPRGAVLTGIVPRESGRTALERYTVTFEVPNVVSTCTACRTEGGLSAHIEKHRHTKKGFDMFLVVLDTRVERDQFDRIRDKCKSSGGWYSRQWGKTPGGFAFEEEPKALEFAQSL